MKIRKLIYSNKILAHFVLLILFSMLHSTVFAQQKLTVQGKIVSADDKQPLPGVTILVKGTKTGATSDFDGMYSISAKKGDILEFSYIGMDKKSVQVTGASLNISMTSNVEGLNEVVVIGYGSVSKKELTGAVAQLKAEDLEKMVTSDLGNAIQGQIAGVNVVSSSGAPGASSEILIRGITSVSGGNGPLYVVDGIPQEGDPRLSTNEIASIDVLKDAASASIYGTRGAGGVILITTKQGKAGSLKVSVDGNYGIQHITSTTPLMNAVEQTYFNTIVNRNRNTPSVPDDMIILELSKSPLSFQNDTDLSKLVFIDNAPVKNYTANISGGTNDIAYNVSAGYFNKEGVIINSEFDRFNIRANTKYSHGKWTINSSVGLSKEEISESPGGIITQTIKYYPTQSGIDPNNFESVSSTGGDETNRLGWVLESFQSTDITNRTSTFGSFNVNFTATDELSFTTRVGLNESNDYRKRFHPYTEIINRVTGDVLSDPSSSSVQMDATKRSSFSVDASVNYQKKIKDHKITFTGAVSVEEYSNDSFYAKKLGVTDNDISVLNGATLSPTAESGSNYTTKLVGTLGRLQYDYKGKYLFSASVRRDGSSKFAEENQWGVFPSISAGWNMSDEKFFEPIKETVNNFKFRASYGTTGNQNFSPYSYSSSISQGLDYAFGPASGNILDYGASQTAYSNAVVKWETSIQSNFGIDLGFFKNKLTLSAEYYNTKKEDMLFPIILPGSAGVGNSNVVLNVGNMTNSGAELAIGYRGRTGAVNWRVNSTFSTNENEITKINGLGGFLYTNDYGLISGAQSSSQVTVLAEGYEAGAFFLYTTNGIANTQEKLDSYKLIDPTAKMGDLIYKDNNDDGKISDADRVYSGSGLSEYEIGLNLNADYKGFDISMQWYAAIGHEIMNGSKATAYGYGRHKDLLYSWSEVNPTSEIPTFRGDTKSHVNYKGYTDLWLEDGSYLRLKALTLGYSLPKNVIEKMGLTKLRLYVTAQNPLTFTKYDGYDPEIGGGIASRGLDKGNYPISSLYLVGFNFNF